MNLNRLDDVLREWSHHTGKKDDDRASNSDRRIDIWQPNQEAGPRNQKAGIEEKDQEGIVRSLDRKICSQGQGLNQGNP